MASYESARAKAFSNATTTTVTGVPLEVSDDHPLRQGRRLPIQVCVCVTDPCPCADHPIIWVDESAVLSRTATGRRTDGDEELVEFAIDAEASVVVESFRRIKAADAAGFAGLARPTARPTFIVRRRPGASRSTKRDRPCHDGSSSALIADPGCNDVEIEENGTTYCFVESSEHYCIYELC
ncbi:hypothetical protein AB0892_11410 [Streptomyces sp. NPDC005409]|uniref:hypothetical protein n=1 Tax=Streptomyces sp. NPDC005409 TaxID=3155342 RepID=UPI0034558751